MLKFALIGYGKMGKALEEAAVRRGHMIAARIFPSAEQKIQRSISEASIGGADVCVDFTTPGAAVPNALLCASLGKPVVIGTTGWDDCLEELRHGISKTNAGIVYGQNFSLGVHFFFKLASYAGELLNRFDNCDLSIHETHHREKADTPSGTALELAKILLQVVESKDEAVTAIPQKKIDPRQLQISSLRSGSQCGAHSIIIDSPSDNITITHVSKNRNSFAEGAVLAAEWIIGKQGIHHFSELL